LNAHDGTGGVCSAEDAEIYEYDSVAIDAEAVDVATTYAVLNNGDSPWDHIKAIGEASLASYIGMTPDGVLTFRVRYNELNESNLGIVDDVASISTSLASNGTNHVEVYGVQVMREPTTAGDLLYSARDSGQWIIDSGKNMKHPIAIGAYAKISGASTIELHYTNDAGGTVSRGKS
jgi:hypothetical protein